MSVHGQGMSRWRTRMHYDGARHGMIRDVHSTSLWGTRHASAPYVTVGDAPLQRMAWHHGVAPHADMRTDMALACRT